MTNRYFAVVPAAGAGKRMNLSTPKQYLPLGDATVLEHSLAPFLACDRIEKVVVALADDDQSWGRLSIANHPKIITTVGGELRFQSVLNALAALKEIAAEDDWVLVHDAVRPCLQTDDLNALIDGVSEEPHGGLLAAPLVDTIKHVENDRVIKTVDRSTLWRALTPQMFRYHVLCDFLTQATDVTDESSAAERAGYQPKIIQGRADNIKVTYPSDLAAAEQFFALL